MLIDICFAVIIILAIIKGYRRGLIVALFSIVAFIIGLAAALKLSTLVAGWLGDSTSISARWLPFISFLVVFFGVVMLVHLGAKLIEKTFQVAMLGWLNRIGGIALYVVMYTILFSVFLFFAQEMNLVKEPTIKASVCYEYVSPWGPKVIDGFGKVIPLFKDMFADLQKFFAGLPKMI
jgi:membrane protein required for colicin V production